MKWWSSRDLHDVGGCYDTVYPSSNWKHGWSKGVCARCRRKGWCLKRMWRCLRTSPHDTSCEDSMLSWWRPVARYREIFPPREEICRERSEERRVGKD